MDSYRGDGPALPPSHDNALLIAALFHRLGGTLYVDAQARRQRMLPAYVRDIPQLPDAEPQEEFHSTAEYRGAMKLADYLLARLAPSDLAFVWDAFATIETAQGSIETLTGRADL